MTPEQLDQIQARADGLTDLCAEHLRQGIRHLQRNCDIECNVHEGEAAWDLCNQPGRADGDRMAAALSDIPALLALVREQRAKLAAVAKLISSPFASADKKHYEDDFNRGHVAGYNAAAHLLRKAIDGAKVKP